MLIILVILSFYFIRRDGKWIGEKLDHVQELPINANELDSKLVPAELDLNPPPKRVEMSAAAEPVELDATSSPSRIQRQPSELEEQQPRSTPPQVSPTSSRHGRFSRIGKPRARDGNNREEISPMSGPWHDSYVSTKP